ncbi:FliM/FliN family flagellar motor switch protein [Citrobacter sp. wls826]|uniref:FliM/FliN family flagellar motor switch protein n=1 Tax=Citrobacter sp. wls826 TaxID=2576415 RepID=UPI0010C9389B|nr:FliM/FliN family flagellar motor switch protein [Citrobacter sp. wls826]TKU24779.1 hypothetical protein FDW87_01850 [Citrobacter sp. wls826]TKV30104.1 hypothetical protein FDX20_27155 [Citrobacter sp. TBCS-11]
MLHLKKINLNDVKFNKTIANLKVKNINFTVGFPDFEEKWVVVTVPRTGWKGFVLLKDIMNYMIPSCKGGVLTQYFEEKIISCINNLKSISLFNICGHSNNEFHLTYVTEPPFPKNTKMICINDDFFCVWLLELPMENFPVNINFTKCELKWNFDFLIGNTVINYSLLQNIAVGDALIIKQKTNIIRCSSKNIGTYRKQKDSIIIMDKIEMANDFDNNDEYLNIQGDMKLLPVKLDFILHSQTFTYDEISRLFEKEILHLPFNAEKKIKIKANGMLIGYGELVEIEDNLGIEIIEWLSKKNDPE